MKLSVQCFTLRNEFAADVSRTLESLRSYSLRYVELAGTYGMSASSFAEKLTDFELAVSGMHVGLGELESELSRLLDEAEALNCPFLILPWIGESDYSAGWDQFARRIEPIADAITQAGRRFAYHNHRFEFDRQANGKTGFDTFFESSGPNVGAEIDVWWAHCGGEDPAELIFRHRNRTPLIHLKDGTECDCDIHAAAGEGILEWKPILAACDKVGVEFGVVELDNSPGSALEAVEKSVRFFRNAGVMN